MHLFQPFWPKSDSKLKLLEQSGVFVYMGLFDLKACVQKKFFEVCASRETIFLS